MTKKLARLAQDRSLCEYIRALEFRLPKRIAQKRQDMVFRLEKHWYEYQKRESAIRQNPSRTIDQNMQMAVWSD